MMDENEEEQHPAVLAQVRRGSQAELTYDVHSSTSDNHEYFIKINRYIYYYYYYI